MRRLILDPHEPLPEGVVTTKGSMDMPLPRPEPALAMRVSESGEMTEALATGVAWGPLLVAFPFGSDHTQESWDRLRQLSVIDELRSLRWVGMRGLHPQIAKEFVGRVVARDGDRERFVTVELPPVQVEALAKGVSPRRMEPSREVRWQAPLQLEHEFVTVEGPPPAEAGVPRKAYGASVKSGRREEVRTALAERQVRKGYWRDRFLALGGGYLPSVTTQLLRELPGVPEPVPDPAPVTIEEAKSEGWIATLHVSPKPIGGFGPSPAEAVGSMLAAAEADFAKNLGNRDTD